jgi:hypothetical protein
MKSLVKYPIAIILILLYGCGEDTKATAEAEALLCDVQKGAVIDKCIYMEKGAVGMAACNEAVKLANLACKRNDLTMMSIIEELQKGLVK